MKIAISIIFAFITISLYSQKPPKGTFKIIVLNTLSKDENSLKVCQTLLTNGYLIDNQKPDSVV